MSPDSTDSVEFEEFTSPNEALVARLTTLERGIYPKPLSADQVAAMVTGKQRMLILLASIDGVTVGFKLGYEFAISETFFSVNGGVLPQYRKRGVATALLLRQHQWAKDQGFRWVRTHTKNKYRDMLLLNIKQGFDVTGVNAKPGETHLGIILTKAL